MNSTPPLKSFTDAKKAISDIFQEIKKHKIELDNLVKGKYYRKVTRSCCFMTFDKPKTLDTVAQIDFF